MFEKYFPFWNKLDDNDKEQMIQGARTIRYDKGFQMLQCESGCNGIMIVKSGQMRTYISSEEGREITLFRVFRDDVCVLSASGLMDAIVFDIMIDAVEDTEIIMIPISVSESIMKKYPEFEAYLYRTATERFADVLWIMQQILFLSVDKRIAQFLWDESVRDSTQTIYMTHEEIARYIGSAREVVTKVLKYFQSENIVTLGRGKITINNKEQLRAIYKK